MKIKGKKIEGPNIEIVVIPRGDGNDIIFKAEAVLDLTPFDKLCPEPKPAIKVKPGGIKIPDLEDKNYLAQLEQHWENKSNWYVITSLRATEGLEWETIDFSEPDTWKNWRTELKDCGFNDRELTLIIKAAYDANCLSESRLQEARNRFLLRESLLKDELIYQKEDQKNMPSGEPVNGSGTNRLALTQKSTVGTT